MATHTFWQAMIVDKDGKTHKRNLHAVGADSKEAVEEHMRTIDFPGAQSVTLTEFPEGATLHGHPLLKGGIVPRPMQSDLAVNRQLERQQAPAVPMQPVAAAKAAAVQPPAQAKS